MTSPRFCQACGTPLVEGARFCGGCGADLAPSAAPTTALPEPAPPPPLVAPVAPPRRRGRRWAAAASVALLAIAVVVVGVVALQLPAGTPDPSVLPDPGAVALTSPPPTQPVGLADPDTPAYDPGTGFSPDAIRVLTVTVLRLSLEEFRAATGAYPADLYALFPAYAPAGPDGTPIAGPPPAAEGYVYHAAGSGYTLSVQLASGQAYTTTNPTDP